MNPLVKDMLAAQQEDMGLRKLEQIFEDDCKCDSPHRFTTCSVKVVAKVTASCDGLSFLKCANGAAYSHHQMDRGAYCLLCDRLARDCWTITPI